MDITPANRPLYISNVPTEEALEAGNSTQEATKSAVRPSPDVATPISEHP
jgi:hypothetical protein